MDEVRCAPDAARIFTDALAGNTKAAERVAGFAGVLAQGIAAMALTVIPDLVVIDGGLSQAGEALAALVLHNLGKLCLAPPRSPPAPWRWTRSPSARCGSHRITSTRPCSSFRAQ